MTGRIVEKFTAKVEISSNIRTIEVHAASAIEARRMVTAKLGAHTLAWNAWANAGQIVRKS